LIVEFLFQTYIGSPISNPAGFGSIFFKHLPWLEIPFECIEPFSSPVSIQGNHPSIEQVCVCVCALLCACVLHFLKIGNFSDTIRGMLMCGCGCERENVSVLVHRQDEC